MHRGVSSTGMNLDDRWWWVLNATLRPLYLRERALVTIVQEAVWSLGPVSMGMEKREFLTPAAVRTQNCPACSELLCLLHYPRPIRDISLPKFDVKTTKKTDRNDVYEEARNTIFVLLTSFTYVYDSLIV